MSSTTDAARVESKITAGALFDAASLKRRMLGRAERSTNASHRSWKRHAEPEELRAQLSAVEVPLGEAEALNALNLRRRPFARRIMRQQGRIDRLTQQAAEIAGNIMLVHAHESPPAVDLVQRALNEFAQARYAQHAGFGKGLIKRLTRNQAAFNRHMADGMSLMDQSVRVLPLNLEDYPDITEALVHLKWHASEALHVQRLHENLPRWRQRIKRNQYEINRCLIICITQLLFILQSLQD